MKKTAVILAALLLATSTQIAGCVHKTTDTEITDMTHKTHETEVSEPTDPLLAQYEAALAHLDKGELEEAYEIFLKIPDYRDVAHYLECFSFRYAIKMERSPSSAAVTAYEYDEYGRELEWVSFSSYNRSFMMYTYEYDDYGNRTKMVRSTSLQDVYTTVYEYDSAGNLIRVTDPNGHVTVCAYDENQNMTERKFFYPSSDTPYQTETYEYDDAGRTSTYTYLHTDGSHIMTYEYDDKGNLIKITTNVSDGTESFEENQYDENGNLIRHYTENTNGIWSLSTREFDDNGRMIKEIFSNSWGDSEIYSWLYNEKGKLIEEICAKGDGESNTTSHRFEYDSDGNRIKQTVSWGENVRVTTYEYDEYGNLVKEIAEGVTSSQNDYTITSYSGYELYYNPYPNQVLPTDTDGK